MSSDQGAVRILDPGAGVGSLGVSLVERVVRLAPGRPIHLTAVEVAPDVVVALNEVRDMTVQWASELGTELTFEVVQGDFLEWASNQLGLFADRPLYDLAIMNPPFKKISARGRSRRITEQAACEVTNLYAAFLALGIRLLRNGGRLSAITPRSFTNGPYFRTFRSFLNQHANFETVDLFESRSSLFADSSVLQENVVFSMVSRAERPRRLRLLFHGRDGSVEEREADYSSFFPSDDPELFIYLRNGGEDHETAKRVNTLPCQLEDLGISVSTGRVVAFRSKEDLRDTPGDSTCPLIYPQHLRGGVVSWPLDSKKPNAIIVRDETASMLFPAGHYVAVKRFTTKEERRRLVPTWVPADAFEAENVAFENHLNVFHRGGAGLERDLAVGLALYLGSSTVDSYFRQFSGHTQVNATDLRCLHYPDAASLAALGARTQEPGSLDQPQIDRMLDAEIWAG